ncbi:MAG: phosphodiester glycosidase family protein [Verrucomicrobiota bacterium]
MAGLGLLLWTAAALCGAAEAIGYKEVSPGVAYAHISRIEGPQSIHVVKFDYHRPDLRLLSTLGRRTVFGLTSLRKEIAALPAAAGRPIAGINGDFFIIKRDPYQGDPIGLQILEGELVSSPGSAACFWMDPEGSPRTGIVRSQCKVLWPNGTETPFRINEQRKANSATLLTPRLGSSTRTTNGVDLILEPQGPGPWLPLQAGRTCLARVREIYPHGNAPIGSNDMILSMGPGLAAQLLPVEVGTRLKLVTEFTPDLAGVRTAIGGGPLLATQGESLKRRSKDPRNPRTAIGWNDKEFFFVVVDGRSKELSIGVGFAELADLMVELGCKEALNLDGGGSTTLWLGGKVVNHPSEKGVERNVANALVLVRKM